MPHRPPHHLKSTSTKLKPKPKPKPIYPTQLLNPSSSPSLPPLNPTPFLLLHPASSSFSLLSVSLTPIINFSSSANRNQTNPVGKDADSSSSSFQLELYKEHVSLSSARRLSTNEGGGSEAEILPTAEVFLPEKDAVNTGGAIVPANDSTVVVEAPTTSLEIYDEKVIRYRRTRLVVTEALAVGLAPPNP